VTIAESDVRDAFRVIAGDLARACADAGEPARIDVGDLADAVYNHLVADGDFRRRLTSDGITITDAFQQIRKHLRAAYVRGRGRYVEL
jgi:hypothetical protein